MSTGKKRWIRRPSHQPAHKLFSYRYRVSADAGPPGSPIVEAGATIIDPRYRGRNASWLVATSMMALESWPLGATYIGPDIDEEALFAAQEAQEAEAAGAPVAREVIAPPPIEPPVPPALDPMGAERDDEPELLDPSLADFGRVLLRSAFGRNGSGHRR